MMALPMIRILHLEWGALVRVEEAFGIGKEACDVVVRHSDAVAPNISRAHGNRLAALGGGERLVGRAA